MWNDGTKFPHSTTNGWSRNYLKKEKIYEEILVEIVWKRNFIIIIIIIKVSINNNNKRNDK